MAKVDIEKIRLGKASLSGTIYAGILDKDGRSFKHKVDVRNDFITCVIEEWNGYKQTITREDGKKFEISVRELKDAK